MLRQYQARVRNRDGPTSLVSSSTLERRDSSSSSMMVSWSCEEILKSTACPVTYSTDEEKSNRNVFHPSFLSEMSDRRGTFTLDLQIVKLYHFLRELVQYGE